MATQAQIEANRLNAQKSTGPKTEEGKDIASQNSFKHGLTANPDHPAGPSRAARRAVITSEDRDGFEHFRRDMLEQYLPDGPMEYILTERLITLAWRLRRSERMETEAIEALLKEHAREKELFGDDDDDDMDYKPRKRKKSKQAAEEPVEEIPTQPLDLSLGRITLSDFTDSKSLDRLSLYERRIERGLLITHQELLRLQKTRTMPETKTYRNTAPAAMTLYPLGTAR